MSQVQSQIEAARAALTVREAKVRSLGLLGATALAATATVLLAGVMVLGPGVVIEDPSVVQAGPSAG
jgi:hypothetical protein